jgi:CMP-N,N'-diacetyllegionaminic acid synthase
VKILALIPARGGSRGIKKKNIKSLDGKPLIAYAIEAAKASSFISDVIVSTENVEIAEISKSYGASVPFIRPDLLASDASPTIDTMVHLVKWLKTNGKHYDAICLLQPTSPFRSKEDIDRAIEAFISKGADCLVSVVQVPSHYNPHWTFKVDEEEDTLYLTTGEKSIIPRRQELPKAYVRNGAIYITKTNVLLNQKSIYGKSIAYHEMDEKRSINIDTMEDWHKAEAYLENQHKNT